MSLKQAATYLRLVNELAGAENRSWRLEELFQRDLNWPRVERQIVPYLNTVERPQFFNSLTVALLPQKGNELQPSFDEDGWAPPEVPAVKYGKNFPIGPILCSYWEDWSHVSEPQAKLGQVRWNPDEVFSVAIDGQHRLAAIQRFAETSGNEEGLTQTHVPIILLILDERLGYRSPTGQSVIEVLRTLFIDLNKHSEKVSRARQILLDDRDPHSLCVRALVGEELKDGSDELLCEPSSLPLNLIDWHTEQARFDDGPYISTILGLDWLVAQALGSKPIRDYMDYSQIRRQIRSFRKSLGVSLSEAEKRLKELEELEWRPFSYRGESNENELKVIQKAFSEVWAPGIVRILTTFLPYRTLIAERKTSGSLTSEFVSWFYLFTRKEEEKFGGEATEEYKRILGRLANRDIPLSENQMDFKLERAEGVKSENLAFNVVFQRALFLAFIEFLKIDSDHLEELAPEDDDDGILDEIEEYEDDDDTEEDLDNTLWSTVGGKASLNYERAEQFVEALNRVVEHRPEFLDKDCPFDREDGNEDPLWAGMLRSSEGPIDFTLGASRRSKEPIYWAAVC